MVPNQLLGFTRGGILQVSAHLEAQAAAILLDFPGRTSLEGQDATSNQQLEIFQWILSPKMGIQHKYT